MYSNTAVFAASRVQKRTWWTCSVLSEAKKLSMGALSRQLPRRLMDCVMPCRWMAMTRASTHSSALRWSAMDQPTISRVAMSLIAARYKKPSSVGM
jgi:hypothetical protein